MAFVVGRAATRLLVPALVGNGVKMALAAQAARLTPPPGVHGGGESESMSRSRALARTALPPAAASGLMVLGVLSLHAVRPAPALKTARFLNLSLASLLAGNGVGSVLFVQPALDDLEQSENVRAEQRLGRRYPEIMRVLMPATVASCLLPLWLIRDRRSAAFRLTLAGTVGFVGMLGTTALEIPINKKTFTASPDSPPADWDDLRADWNRFNRLRTLCEVAGWSCLCLGALADRRPKG